MVEIATTDPVTLRGLTVRVPGTSGIRGVGGVDLTVERSTVLAVNPPIGVPSTLIVVSNDVPNSPRARLVVRHSFLDGAVPNPPTTQSFAVQPRGDVDALIEGNVLRRAGGACIFLVTRADLGGELNADILNNDLDECHPFGRAGAILVGPLAVNLPSPERPLTATGIVNIIGNTIRNSTGACLTSAIHFEVYTGRIERNRIIDVVKPCAAPTGRNLPSAIWIGRLTPAFPFPPVDPTYDSTTLPGTHTPVFESRRTRRLRSTRRATTGDRSGGRRAWAVATETRFWSNQAAPHPCSCRLPRGRLPDGGSGAVDRRRS